MPRRKGKGKGTGGLAALQQQQQQQHQNPPVNPAAHPQAPSDNTKRMPGTIVLYCWVHGDERPFPVAISRKMTVGEVKEAMVTKNPNRFRRIDAASLILWKVDIPHNYDAMNQHFEFKASEALLESWAIEKYFEADPPQEHINIIVKAPVVPKKRSYEEAIGLNNLVIISEDRLSEFDRQWNRHKINLLRSPPGSGKTTFSKRLELYSKKKIGRVVRQMTMTAVTREAMDNANSFDDAWEKIAGESWSSCLTCTVPTDIIIDEAQTLYGNADFFWLDIKSLLDDPNPNIRVLLLSMYSVRPGVMDNQLTPITFLHPFGLECLRLTRTEFDQLVENFINLVLDEDGVELSIPLEVRDVIFNITAGHSQLVRKSLGSLKIYSRRPGDFTVPDMLCHLVSHDYYYRIEELCVFDALRNLEMTDDNIKFLRNAYHHIDSDSTFPVDSFDNQVYDATQRFKRSGLITEAHGGSRMQFAVPLMRVLLGRKLFTARISTQSPTQSGVTFDAFLLLSLERMCPLTLSASLSHSSRIGARLIERQWQTAWLTAANTAVPLGSTISPDVGAVYGSPGYMDFYVDGTLQWGVELMREGKRLADHVARFASDGRYSNIPLTHWAIIDFRHHSTVPKTLESNVWYVMYSNDYKTITVRRQGHEDEVVTLCGAYL